MTVLVDAKPWPDWPEGFPHGAISGRAAAGLAEHTEATAPSTQLLLIVAGLAGGVAALLFERFLDRVVRNA